ncbi:Serine hydroxymethyltransferase, cytosolic [Chytridiales sp. JEL 0842]|nr:Serine hydroxymethyltransferase, cytosolic [Chytridiales sp. JEL 0842]
MKESDLEPFLLLAKGAKGGACVQMIQDVLNAPGIYVFGELLESPNIAETLYYEKLQQVLDIPSVRELEDLVIDAIYQNLLEGKLDQKRKCLVVEYAMGRDLKPGDSQAMLTKLTEWLNKTDSMLSAIDQKLESISVEEIEHKQRKEDYEKSVEALKKENTCLNTTLEQEDAELFDLINKEKWRQYSCLELIASENFTSQAVMEANGSALTNKYSEGLPGHRYYGGNEFVDQIENLCRDRALKAFRLSPEQWGVNVQPYSGSTANFCALTAMLAPHDRIMGLELASGGHLTHGHQTAKKKISSSAIYFESFPYQVDNATGLVDYNKLEANADLFRPKLIICGASAYPRDWDYARLRSIADKHGAYLMADIAHISGLVATQEQSNPFDFCDIVTTTTHKTLRGPRAGIIFFRRAPKGEKNGDLEEKVNFAVFPSNQGGPHNNTIAAVAVALKQVAEPSFKQYCQQVRANSKAIAKTLLSKGYKLVTDGTDNHLVLWDLRPIGLTGSKMEKICDYVNITLNKNSVHGDTSSLVPGGVRIGAPALTSRSFKEEDFVQVAEFLHRAAQIAVKIQATTGKLLKDFVVALEASEEVKALRAEVTAFAHKFPMPGFDPASVPESARHH